MLDHEEIPGSLGTSNIFMESKGHRILFGVKGVPGYIEIRKKGFTGFEYECNIGGQPLIEITQQISGIQNDEAFDIKITDRVSASDGYSESVIVWYQIEVTRLRLIPL
jgi:hypothetical protein